MARAFVIALAGLCLAFGAAAADALTPDDYRWLSANLNVAHDSLVLQGLSEDQKARIHAMIAANKSLDWKQQGVADFLYRSTGTDFDKTLTQSEQ